MKLRDLLSKKLTKKEMEFLRTSFDTIGDIAIIDIPDELKKKEKDVAKAIISIQPNILDRSDIFISNGNAAHSASVILHVREAKKEDWHREKTLLEMSGLESVYIPSLYQSEYDDEGKLVKIQYLITVDHVNSLKKEVFANDKV